MDLSPLIFVAVAVAWAVYLIPTALRHHDDVTRSRSVDRFSHTMRVLARREPLAASARRRAGAGARLVVTPGRARSVPEVTTKGDGAPAPADVAEIPEPAAPAPTRREAAARATRRRRRVLGLILLAGATVVILAATGVVAWWWTAAPAGVLVAWLVACRLMVRSEQRARAPRPAVAEPAEEAPEDDAFAEAHTASTPAITDDTDPSLWDPMPVTLPTYVSKEAAAPRTVRTIDLDSTGVWTSGHTDADSRLAREADEAERASRSRRQQGDGRRAAGS